jgi:hypothetical protein
MLISCKYNFLFIHIAKTGGTSVRSALTPLLLKDPSRWIQYLCNRLSGLSKHRLGVKFPRHAKAVAALEILPSDMFHDLFKFAFVRNPWDLQVSSYHHVQRERPHLMEHIDNFDHFLKWKLQEDRPYHYILDASGEPQWYSLIDLQGQCLVDFVGRYENLQADFAYICQYLGLKKIPRLPHRRQATERRDYRSYYSQESAELVARHYALDIQSFGYCFDPK